MKTFRAGRRAARSLRSVRRRPDPVLVVDLLQNAKAALAGVIAWVVAVQVLGMGTMLVVAFLLGRHRWLRDESTTIATTGIVVLATNAVFQPDILVSRLLDTTVGVVVGLLVNLVVWPPLRDRAVWAVADELPGELADVLAEMATGLGPRGSRTCGGHCTCSSRPWPTP